MGSRYICHMDCLSKRALVIVGIVESSTMKVYGLYSSKRIELFCSF